MNLLNLFGQLEQVAKCLFFIVFKSKIRVLARYIVVSACSSFLVLEQVICIKDKSFPNTSVNIKSVLNIAIIFILANLFQTQDFDWVH